MNSNSRFPVSVIILITFLLVPAVFAQTDNIVYPTDSRQLTITPIDGKGYRLEWTRESSENGWIVQSSTNPYVSSPQWQTVLRTSALTCDLDPFDSTLYYRVVADPSAAVISEFNWLTIDSSITLSSYGTGDVDTAAWSVVPGGDNGLALRLTGNSWKVLQLQTPRRITRDFAVGVSVKRETKSEWQAIGFVDSSGHAAWFTFGGKETRWGDSIYNSWSEVPPFNYWSRWRLPVGEQFASFYQRNGYLTQIVFVNDNDTTNPDGIWQISRLTDATGDQYLQPELSARISSSENMSVSLEALSNGQPITRGVVTWEGDAETRAQGQTAQLSFRQGGDKKILCRWIDVDRVERWIWLSVHIDATPLPKTSFTYCAVGDIMIARRIVDEGVLNRVGLDGLFGRVSSYLRGFDLTTGNTECAYSIVANQHPNKTYTFKGLPDYVPVFTRNGIQIASLANNHTGDYGDDALRETFDHYNENGLMYTGAGLNDGEAWRPAIVYRGGQRIAVFGYCTLTGRDQNQAPYLDAAPHKGGFNWARRDIIDEQFAKVRPYVDFIIVQFHIGLTEYVTDPDAGPHTSMVQDPEEDAYELASSDTMGVNLADYMLDHGADLVICHGPHVPQGVVKRPNGKYIAYSLGNFLFDQYLPETFPSISFEADVNRFSRVREARIRPIYIDGYLPGPASGRVATRILNHIGALSVQFGTALVEPADGSQLRVIGDSAYFTSISLPNDTLTIPLDTSGSIRISAPIQFSDTGVVDRVELISPDTGTVSYRLGTDQLYGVGDMEDEGSPTFLTFPTTGALLDDSLSFAGRRSLRLRRTSGTSTLSIPTVQRWVIDRNSNYTVCLRVLPGAAAGTNLRLDWWRARVGDYGNGNLLIFQPAPGNQWLYMYADLNSSNIPDRTNCLQFRFRQASTGVTSAYFDDLAFVLWGFDWTSQTTFTLPNPHEWTHLQVQTSNYNSTSMRVILHRSRLVATSRD